jgi:hypothetical protein
MWALRVVGWWVGKGGKGEGWALGIAGEGGGGK